MQSVMHAYLHAMTLAEQTQIGIIVGAFGVLSPFDFCLLGPTSATQLFHVCVFGGGCDLSCSIRC